MFGRIAIFSPEIGKEAVTIAIVDDASEIRVDVENHPRWICYYVYGLVWLYFAYTR